MHILIITPGFAANKNDEACTPPVQAFVRALTRNQPQLKASILSLHYPLKKARYKWHNIEVVSCGGNNRSFPARFTTWAHAVKAIKSLNNTQPINIIHSLWGTECAFLGQQAARWLKIPQVITFMGQDSEQNNYHRFINFKKAYTVCLSEFHSTQLCRNFSLKPNNVIPWGVAEEDFPPITKPRTIDVIGAGSLIPLKNFTEFPRLVKRLKQDFPQIKAVLVGSGPQAGQIKQEIIKLGLQQNLELAGQLLRSQVLQLMAQSKVLFHPSVFESQGYVFNEAAMCGCGIVSRQVGIARNSAQWIIAQNPQEQYEATKKLLLQKNFTKRNLYSIDETVAAYMQIYRNPLL